MRDGSSSKAGGLWLGDYLHVLWRWKVMIVVLVCASAFGAWAYSWRQPPRYRATAAIIYVEPVDPSDPLGATYYSGMTRDLAVENVLDLAGSSQIAAEAEKTVDVGSAGSYSVSATARGGTSASSYGGVVEITVSSGDAEASAALANAYAQAIVDLRQAQQLQRIKTAEQAVQAGLDAYVTKDSRLSSDYAMLKERLQSLKLLETTAAGDFKLVSEAVPPSTPYSPKPVQSAVIGLGVGLLVGIGLAFLLEPLTTRVRGKQEAAEVLGLPVVGTLPEIEKRKQGPGRLAVLSDPRGPVAEALRLLRSNIEYANVDKASSLLVTSALAGEGKSTVVCNLAVTMTLAGKRVVIVDGDIHRPRVHENLGINNYVGLSSVLTGRVELADALNRVELRSSAQNGGEASPSPTGDGSTVTRVPVVVGMGRQSSQDQVVPGAVSSPTLYVLTAGPQVSDPGELMASRRFGRVVRGLQAQGADLVIVDSPALLEVGDAAAMAAQTDALVVVVDLKRAHLPALGEMRDLLAPLPCKQLGVILVKAKGRSSSYGHYYS